ncbi:MAG: hypothetical protein KatS3mg061_0223 [Dehalococcoidia bacterium]|nr:MAG: hypothetical protein KatS3mg061_0223 [Dehalococcoidia bacterium]
MLRIGELAKQAGVAPSLLRYYEQQGLVQPGSRTQAGYRLYGPEALGRIRFIQRAKALGLSLREVRRLLQDPADPPTELARLRHLIAHKVADTRRRIAELGALCADLEALYQRLSAGAPVCGHLGDCECWLPSREEGRTMTNETCRCRCCGDCTCSCEAGACCCCGCTCPCEEEHCPCCGCLRHQ